MISLRDGVLAAGLSAAIATGAWTWWLQTRLEVARLTADGLAQQLDTAKGEARDNLASANELKSTLEREREGQAKLLQLQGELRNGLANRERQIEELKHENQELRNWADQPLPDIARRLRQRPAIVGADAYRQWLSGGSAVPATGDSAEQERPIAK